MWCAVYSVQCVVSTCSDSGPFAGAGAVRNVHFAVFSVHCAACKDIDLVVETG